MSVVVDHSTENPFIHEIDTYTNRSDTTTTTTIILIKDPEDSADSADLVERTEDLVNTDEIPPDSQNTNQEDL